MGGGSGEQWVFRLAKKTPSRTAAPRLAPSRRNPTSLEPKTPIPTAPRKKAGPQLLQNRERRRASSRLGHPPRSTSWAMVSSLQLDTPRSAPAPRQQPQRPPRQTRGYIPPGQGTGTEPSHPCFDEQGREHKKGKERGDQYVQAQRDPLPGPLPRLSSGKANSRPPMQSRPAPSTKIRRYPFIVHPPSNMLIRMRLSLKSCLPLLGLRPGDWIGYNRTKFGS